MKRTLILAAAATLLLAGCKNQKDMDNPFIGIAESYGYMKAVCQLA